MEMSVDTIDEAIRLFYDALNGGDFDELEKITFGDWASTNILIEGGFDQEINGPFLTAYSRISEAMSRLYAQSKFGSPDNRMMRSADPDEFEFRVKVKEGSADLSDNIQKLLEKVSEQMVTKMSGAEVVIAVVGLGLLAAGYFGWKAYLDNRAEIRKEEINSSDRVAALDGMRFATEKQNEVFRDVVDAMHDGNALTNRALEVALDTNRHLLKAASRTKEITVDGVLLEQEEAKELLGYTRRSSETETLEKNLKVLDVNTSEPLATSAVLQDPDTKEIYRVTFRDRIIDARDRAKIIAALDSRALAWFKLSVRRLAQEIVSVQILEIGEARS